MRSFQRFIDAQNESYEKALNEIKNGKKVGHWMWYIFPQMNGLGSSDISFYYSLYGIEDAKDYLNQELLSSRLNEISSELLKLEENDPKKIFGEIDSLKLQSSMTLFHLADPENPIFQQVLDKYYYGEEDNQTIELCQNSILKK